MKKIYGVIGDPIRHSMSPDIHNDAFARNGIDACYLHFHVKANQLEEAVKGMKAIGVEGFNVTVPHKTAILPLLDEVDEMALAMGAVNTVKKVNGRYIGYNTDGAGFVTALHDKIGRELTSLKTIMIGAGGAARGIYYALSREGLAKIDICNRTIENAEHLIADCPYHNVSEALSIKEAELRLGKYDLIIQTTSIGMSPNVDSSPLKLDLLSEDAFVSDIIYNPLETKIMKTAREKGAAVQNGVDMFVCQAALAFQIWTGIFPDISKMRDIVLDKLGGS
ncbi:shikimate dehydrogenase [Peribacillus saganii]|uniref:Shikimate dehydrogenase (NADP(+)) n=1 Tax=Peribacillus saganii TaxID=2303992 RepID=A0A372LTX5_9BACI|nr:shikimate dehydrogenase [Peribacillus saganii]RFU71653.1 shikimate dehydrogenase [Peribacillus saganii]